VKSMHERLVQWLLSDDIGLSSQTMVARFEGVKDSNHSHPHDPADLGRCLRLLQAVPEYVPRLHEMKEEGPVWAALVDNWEKLEKLYYKEKPTGSAPECYKAMREIIEEARR